ncbi:FecR family protein [Aureibaculum sp. 2210JD6-5]|uniref:FecR family protein n=1 Tax=Aureibaculum sp. 2210JD6-5 TaxID=3103957 RepID=UPI002AAC8962|nr:FecR family protein [Aureibaculum sp. 2210JD6-5]MDY7394716.1 FecR family protein [Aureibaculum sp. 2210JD6-5]
MNQDEILKKWLTNDLNTEELKAFEEDVDFELNSKIIEGAEAFKASNFSETRSYEQFKTIRDGKTEPKVVRFSPNKVLLRVAAIIVISLGLFFTFFNNRTTTIKTLASQKQTFDLPDASTVILNNLSTVSFNKKTWEEKRELTLKGEAFFKVAKGSKFDVNTSAGVVSVRGTQFTVNQRDSFFEVKCFEGVVHVESGDVNQILTIGKSLSIRNGKLKLDEIKQTEPTWITDRSTFKSIPLIEVLNEVERQFAVEITVKDIDTEQLFTGGFTHLSLEQALQSITSSFNLKYKREGPTKILLYSSE